MSTSSFILFDLSPPCVKVSIPNTFHSGCKQRISWTSTRNYLFWLETFCRQQSTAIDHRPPTPHTHTLPKTGRSDGRSLVTKRRTPDSKPHRRTRRLYQKSRLPAPATGKKRRNSFRRSFRWEILVCIEVTVGHVRLRSACLYIHDRVLTVFACVWRARRHKHR